MANNADYLRFPVLTLLAGTGPGFTGEFAVPTLSATSLSHGCSLSSGLEFAWPALSATGKTSVEAAADMEFSWPALSTGTGKKGNMIFPVLDLSANGTVILDGNLSNNFPMPGLSATGKIPISALFSESFPMPDFESPGNAFNSISASLSASLPMPTFERIGTGGISGSEAEGGGMSRYCSTVLRYSR